jgi:hypothetical protein
MLSSLIIIYRFLGNIWARSPEQYRGNDINDLLKKINNTSVVDFMVSKIFK